MDFALIPQPKKLTARKGAFRPPATGGAIGISDAALFPVAEQARPLFKRASIGAVAPGQRHVLSLGLVKDLTPERYRLSITTRGIAVEAGSVAGASHAVRTLGQIVAQGGKDGLPCLRIDDWPDFADRGVYYDVCRGRVPKLERLMELAELLAAAKINQLQLYVEHTFQFRGHPKIGTGASPLSAEDILELDAYCRELHIELLPSLASFGHLATVLKHPEYHHLAEDWGIGKYVDPEAAKHRCIRGWTLSPANPQIYDFLDSLFAEFLPLFSSKRFNVCCDETWDLGLGQSYELCQQKGKGRVYLDHIIKLNKLCRKYGKRMMFWGDIIRHHPELIDDIPRDVTVLDWGYSARMDFDRVKDFTATGLDTYVCPSVCGYVTLFPRVPESSGNIAGWAEAGARHGAKGMLNTDWGDGGHYNFMECAWYGYLFGAEQSWNIKADRASFTQRFCRQFLGSDRAAVAQAVDELGEVSELSCAGFYQSIWQHIFFATPGEGPLQLDSVDAVVSPKGRIQDKKIAVDAKLGRETLRRLARVRKVLEAEARRSGTDPHGVLPYWLFAIDTIAHAAAKLTVLGPGGKDTPAARRSLRSEQTQLMKRFNKLWLDRNRPSEIRTTLARYRRAIRAL